jgi:hypothetical protein
MSSLKDIKSAERSAAQQKEVLVDLTKLIEDIERCEKTVIDLQAELDAVTSKYQGPRTTRDDIEYLTLLLKCANKKLAWEKHMASVQKRTPLLLEKMSTLLNDEKNPPEEQIKGSMLKALQGLQAAMERLQAVKVS